MCCDTGGGPFARQWVTAKAGLVDLGYVKATGHSLQITLPKGHSLPEMSLEWNVPEKSNAIERDRARSYHQAYSAAVALYNVEKALAEVRAGRTKSCVDVTVPDEAVSVGFHEAARGVLSHHMVIKDGKIANYQPYPPTPWNASPRDTNGTPGPYEDAVQNTPIFEENGPDKFKGVDIMRAVRSFDPCLPCGVHMYGGKGQVRKVMHPPTGALVGVERRELLQRIQQLTDELERVDDPHARAVGEQLVAAVIDMHGEGLGRHARGPGRPTPAASWPTDGVVGSLMLIHGLYPESLEDRVQRGAGRVRPYMESHGGNIELLGIEDGVARLRLEGSCDGCGASQSTLELTVERALREAAPDLRGMDVEGAAPLEEITGMPLPMAVVGRAAPEKVNGWIDLDGAMDITPGSLSPMERGGPAHRGGQRGGRAARLPRLLRGLRRVAGLGDPGRGRAVLPRLRAALLPAARRPVARRRAAPARRPCRCCASGARRKVALPA